MFSTKRDIEGDVPTQPEGESDLDKMAQQVQNLFNIINFYDQMNFNSKQRLAITKDITELIDPSRSSGLAKKRS